MGNTGSIQLKEGSHVLKVEESIIREFQHYITVADHSMTGLAKSIDAMRTSCKLRSNGDEMTQGGQDNNNRFYDLQLVSDLLLTLDECVKDHEYVHMESLSKLFRFVLSIGKDYITSSEDEHINFSVDRYMFQQTVADIENGKQYYDLRIATLQKSIEDMKGAFKVSEEEVENLNRREELYQKEKQTMKNTEKKLESDVIKLKAENDKAKNENAELLAKVDESHRQTLGKLQNELSAEREKGRKAEEIYRTEKEESLREAQELNQNLQEKIESLNTQLKNISTDISEEKKTKIESYENTIEKLNTNIDEMKVKVNELKGIENENTELKQSLENEKNAIEKLKTKVFSLDSANDDLKLKDKHSKEENKRLAETIADQNQRMEALQIQIEMLKNKKIMHLQLYHQFGFSAETGEEELCTLLKNKLAYMCIELNVIKIEKPAHVDLTEPLLLSCTKNTMFKKDRTVANSLKDFPKATKKIAVVIYHLKDQTAFNKEAESIDKEAGKDTGGIFNIGYKNAIYRCRMNSHNIEGIIDFLLEGCDNKNKASRESELYVEGRRS